MLYYQTPPLGKKHASTSESRSSYGTPRTIHYQNTSGTAREPTPRRSGAVEMTEQQGNINAGGIIERRRHPQEQDERFS